MQKQGYKSKTIPFLPAHSIYGFSKKLDIWTIKKNITQKRQVMHPPLESERQFLFFKKFKFLLGNRAHIQKLLVFQNFISNIAIRIF